MNCRTNYGVQEENMNTKYRHRNPVSVGKMVSWKTKITTPFKTLQECVGQSRIQHNKPRVDRQLDRSKHPRVGRVDALGTVRLVKATWQDVAGWTKRCEQ